MPQNSHCFEYAFDVIFSRYSSGSNAGVFDALFRFDGYKQHNCVSFDDSRCMVWDEPLFIISRTFNQTIEILRVAMEVVSEADLLASQIVHSCTLQSVLVSTVYTVLLLFV